MKKFLLPAALLILASGANAQELMELTDCFGVYYNNAEVKEGSTIEITDFQDMSELYGPDAGMYSADIEIKNLDVMPGYIDATLYFTDSPSGNQYMADPTYWGDPQLCYEKTVDGNPIGSCCSESKLPLYAATGCFEVPVENAGTFKWQIHILGANKNADETYSLALQAKDGEGSSAKAISFPFRFKLHFSTGDSGVDSVTDAADAPAEWFDLQGRRVVNPAKGLYICRKGGSVSKILVK